MTGDDLNNLIDLIDDAALDEGRWPDVLRGIADALGGHNASMVRHDHASGRAQAIGVDLDPAVENLFLNYYSALNPLRQHSEIDEAYGRRAVVVQPRVRELLLHSEYYNDFLKPFSMAHLSWVFLARDGNDVTLLNVGRPLHKEAFDSAELRDFTRLMPHLMRSYRIGHRLGGMSAASVLENYLDLLPHGVLLLDALGRVMHANRVAEAIAASQDGFSFTHAGLTAALPQAHRRLTAMIAQAAHGERHLRHARSLALPRPSGARPYAVAVCPFGDDRTPLLFGRPSVLVEIRDLTADEVPMEGWLAECLNLTSAEARVAGLLMTGLDRGSIASRLGIAGNTVRVHIARLMGKTGTHRQSELMQLLGRVAALKRSPPTLQ